MLGNANYLEEKWAPLLDAEGVEKISDPHRRAVTAAILKNQEKALKEEAEANKKAASNAFLASSICFGFKFSAIYLSFFLKAKR